MRTKNRQPGQRQIRRSFFRMLALAAVATVLFVGSAGGQACAQTSIWGWGDNTSAQLGRAPDFEGDSAYDTGAETFCYRPTPAQLSLPATVTTIASGGNHTVALDKNGNVWAWGDNTYGELGHAPGSNGDGSFTVGIETSYFNPKPAMVGGLPVITAIAAGGESGYAVDKNGNVWAWGDNTAGELGHAPGVSGDVGSAPYYYNPAPTKIGGLSNITAVIGGESSGFSLALDKNANVWAWGDNGSDQLGHDAGQNGDVPGNGTGDYINPTPAQIGGLSHIVAIAASYPSGLALDNSGSVWAWGGNYSGELGTTNRLGLDNPTPAIVGGLPAIAAIAAGTSTSLALDKSGNVWGWGLNTLGQTGASANSGTTGPNPTPTKIAGVSNVTAIAAGAYFTLALDKRGNVWIWGGGAEGQLGNSINVFTNVPHPTPTQILKFTGATAIAAGGAFCLALGAGPCNSFALQNPTSGQLAYWLTAFQNGEPTLIAGNYLADSLPAPWRLASVADLNGDGYPDLIRQNSVTGDIAVWYVSYADGAAVTSGGYIAQGVPSALTVVGAADFNQDGEPDLLVRNASTGDVEVWYLGYSGGTVSIIGGTFIAHGFSTAWTLVGAADFDQDGYPDLLWRDAAGDAAWWRLAYSDGAISSVGGGYIAKGFSTAWKLVGAYDLNGDGEPDLLWRNNSTGQLSWWQLAYANNAVSAVGGGFLAQSLPTAWTLGGGF